MVAFVVLHFLSVILRTKMGLSLVEELRSRLLKKDGDLAVSKNEEAVYTASVVHQQSEQVLTDLTRGSQLG